MPVLTRLKAAGIVIHAQIVLCPGINDGEVLRDSIERLRPVARSLAVVPVGLTKYGNRALRAVSADDARAVLNTVRDFQERYLKADGGRFVWCADEFCLKAGITPLNDAYEGYPQLDNGVGMLKAFDTDARAAVREYLGGTGSTKPDGGDINGGADITKPDGTDGKDNDKKGKNDKSGGADGHKPDGGDKSGSENGKDSNKTDDKSDDAHKIKRFDLITGASAYSYFCNLCGELNDILPDITICVHAVPNRFLGESITVAGLITGGDIAAALRGKELSGRVLIPDTMLKAGETVFLDDMTVAELSGILNAEVVPVPVDGYEFIDVLTAATNE
jgi:NifB/MoaA-like Fe-S oxidoreductase